MRICQVSSCFPPSRGGVETFVYCLSKKLVEKGHQVKVITSDRGKIPNNYHDRCDGIEVVRYPEKYHLLEAPIIPQIAFHLMRENFDILHIHGMVPTVSDLALLMGKLKRKPIVLTYHYDAETPKYGTVGRLAGRIYASMAQVAVRLADKIVATTESYARTSFVLGSVIDRVIIVPCGVDVERFFPHQTLQGNAATHKKSNHRILYVGKLIHYKGVDVLIRAFKIVAAEMPNCSLIIVGDGEQRAELMNLVERLGLTDQIVFTGWLPDKVLPMYYQTSDLLVLPSITSRREAFGMVLLEAMACGLPAIASNIPGPNDVVSDKENGLLTPPRNSEKLAEAIINLLQNMNNPERRMRISTLVKKRYAWNVIADSYENLYRSLLGLGDLNGD